MKRLAETDITRKSLRYFDAQPSSRSLHASNLNQFRPSCTLMKGISGYRHLHFKSRPMHPHPNLLRF